MSDKRLRSIDEEAANAVASEEAENCAERRALARQWLESVGVNPSQTPEDALDLIGAQIEDLPGSDASTILHYDADLGIIATEDGEFVASIDAVEGDDRVSILKNVGERLTKMKAKLAARQAEKEAWMAQVEKAYDKQIRRAERAINGLKWTYGPMAQSYLDDVRASAQEKPPASANIGLLTIKYKTQLAKTEIDNDAAALEFLRPLVEDGTVPKEAIKVSESILHSKIPAEIKESAPPESGIAYRPAGDLVFEIDI